MWLERHYKSRARTHTQFSVLWPMSLQFMKRAYVCVCVVHLINTVYESDSLFVFTHNKQNLSTTHTHMQIERDKIRIKYTIVTIHMDSMSAMKTENRATSFELCNTKHRDWKNWQKKEEQLDWNDAFTLLYTRACMSARSFARSFQIV